MEKIYIGKVVKTHGIKGEIRILSNFQFKDKVFILGNNLIIDDDNYEINSYRIHKNFDMVTFYNYNNINDVLFLIGKKVYFDKDKLLLDDNEVLDEDLLKYNVLSIDGKKGTIKEIFMAGPSNKILRILFDKEILIPMNSPMIKKIDKNNKTIIIELIEGI